MLLRDNRQMAISAVETLCFETADSYASAAGRTDDPALKAVFGELAEQRGRLAAELAAHIRALDDLPQQPDPDREALTEFLSGIKAALSGDARAVIVGERERAEQGLADATRQALEYSFPTETRAMLERVLAHSMAAMTMLTNATKPQE